METAMKKNTITLLWSLLIMIFFSSLISASDRRAKRDQEIKKKPVKVAPRASLKDHVLYDYITDGDLIDINEFDEDGFSQFEPTIEGLPLVTSDDVDNAYDPQLKVIKISGNVFVESFAHEKGRLKVGDWVRKWDKFFTLDTSAIHFHVGDRAEEKSILKIEIGSKSVAQLRNVRAKSYELDLILMSGKLTARIEKGEVMVRTPTSSIRISKGHTDVIISAMNTLVAPRDGAPVVVKTVKATKTVRPGFYGLANDSGSLIISEAISDRIDEKPAIIKRREITEPFKDSKPLMKVNEQNQVRRRERS